MKELFKEDLDSDAIKLSVKLRWILLPVMIINWLIQLFVFSIILGLAPITIGIVGLLMTLFSGKDGEDIKYCLFIISMPFIFPFLWWYRYVNFGEYGSLIND